MPLLLHRRSVLDLLSTHTEPDDPPRPETATSAHPPRPRSPAAPPRPASAHGFAPSRLSRELRPEDVSGDEAPAPDARREKRFSLLKLRNFSESQLSVRAQMGAVHEEPPPPVPRLPSNDVPAIVRTAPTMEEHHPQESEEGSDRKVRPSLFKRSMSKGRDAPARKDALPRKSSEQPRGVNKSKTSKSLRWRRAQGSGSALEDLARLSSTQAQHQNTHSAPPSYGDVSNSALALPVPDPRFSESSQSDGSNASSGEQIYGQTTTTTHTISTHTTFFKLPRRNKNRTSLFPLPVKLPPPDQPQPQASAPATPRASTSAQSARSLYTPRSKGAGSSSPGSLMPRRHTESSPARQSRQRPPPMPSPHAALAKGSLSFAEPGMGLFRNESQRSRNSSNSSPLQPPVRPSLRDRASTTSSYDPDSQDLGTPSVLTSSARNSTSTAGRPSLGGFLSLARFRQSSDPHSPRHGSPGTRSKSSSFALSREALVIPEREEGDTPGKYLERLEAAVARSMIAGILSKSADPFAQAVLRSYTRRFPFFGEPIDMSLRKFLLEAELPKETQQVDRVIQAFADRYHECNPGIFVSPDQAYIIAFSLMMLHTDAFNKNNKRKMQKQDYIKNTSGQHVSDEVLACFYDNICYTPFVHYEEEVDINGERVMPFKPKKSKLRGTITDTTGKKLTGPVDPYNLLVDQKLDWLRPAVKEAITFDDPYNYRGSQSELDPQYLQRAFSHTGILQIISARSRPTAYEGQFTDGNFPPAETQAGIIDLKITKVGTLWRKATKKKKARSPWQEWGAILTGSQLYLFKNAHWAKSLVHQFTGQQKPGQPRTPVIFKPPLQDFKPDALVKTDNAVALVDSSYNRHKHAFTFFHAGGLEEVLLADNEAERNDWLALINYAAAFRAAGVRIRGMVGGNGEDLRRPDVSRRDSTPSKRSVPSPTGEAIATRGGLSPQLQRQIMAARRQIMVQKIAESERESTEANKQLDGTLRNARHLLVLAPIAPKTREDVIHAAARTDAMIKWLRREIWRMKCYKDILAMDVQQDGVSASELQTLTSQQIAVSGPARRESKTPALQRLGSKASAAQPAYSPPQSPTSPVRSPTSERRSMTESIETFMGNDVFRTPTEMATEQENGNFWHLPPVQLDVQPQDEHRASVSTTYLTVSSPGRGSLSHTSSTSSIRQLDRLDSPKPSEVPSQKERKKSSASMEQAEMLARSAIPPETVVPSSSRGMSMDGVPPTSTPDSKHKGVRRSLHKTLREAHHHPNSIHKHRRNKESEGTVRSGGADAEEPPDGTPGLQREKGRFILHGKQASIVQFGADWPDERMKLRRERFDKKNASSQGEDSPQRGNRFGSYSAQGMPSTSRELRSPAGSGQSEAESDGTAHAYSFKEDAVAADAFANSASLRAASSSDSDDDDDAVFFDVSQWDTDIGKRQTVIGPQSDAERSLKEADAETVESSDEERPVTSMQEESTVGDLSPQLTDGAVSDRPEGSSATVKSGNGQNGDVEG